MLVGLTVAMCFTINSMETGLGFRNDVQVMIK